jgi:hypothetical protein
VVTLTATSLGLSSWLHHTTLQPPTATTPVRRRLPSPIYSPARDLKHQRGGGGGDHGCWQEQEDLEGKEGWEEKDVSLLACSSRSSDLARADCFVPLSGADV